MILSPSFKKIYLFLTVILSFATLKAEDLTPVILHPDPANGALLYGLSDNGDWGVSNTDPGYIGFSDFAGGTLYDLRSNPVKKIDLSPGETYCSVFDVTDDGKIVGGSVRQRPAICKLEDGKWNWYYLPIPDREVRVRDVYTDSYTTYKINGGEVSNLTPDGKYAVGSVHCIEYINIEVGCMWDLETMEMISLPGLNLENSTFSRLTQISADGRYVVGRRGGYFVYDRETQTSQSARVGLDIYAQGMSTNGKYLSGVSHRNDVPYASFWDIENNKLTILDDDIYADAVAWTITNDGVPLIARPYLTPYATAYVYHEGFLYPFSEILTQVYNINLAAEGIDVTGKPFKVSEDGKTIVFITGAGQSYVLRLKEDIRDALSRVNLYKNWNASPMNGSHMSAITRVSVSFSYPVELVGSTENVALLDEEGNVVAQPIQQGGVVIDGSVVNIQFRGQLLKPDKKYTVRIPEGIIGFRGNTTITNPELTVNYYGREDVPVEPVSISPAPGTVLSTISLAENPIVVKFNAEIKVNVPDDGNRPIAKIYIDGETDLVGFCNIDVDLNTGNTLVIFPENTIPFYKGSNYTIVVPQDAVTDLSGRGGCEKFTITYEGAYVPQLSDEKYLFHSTCDDYTNFLFYEGDHGVPVEEYQEMGFTQSQTPWVVVRESYESTDMAFGSHSVYSPSKQSDDWVTTRQILIPEDTETYLAFDSQSYRKQKSDYLKVYIYENTAIINNLNKLIVDDIRANGDLVYNELQSPGATEQNLSGEWTHNVIDLSPYAGKAIYICFLNDNKDQSMVMIDNIEVVRDVKAFVTLRNKTTVVNQKDISIWGILSVSSESSHYNTLKLELKDYQDNVISTINADNLNLTAGDYYNFEFDRPLPLEYGEENAFTITYTLDNDVMTYDGVVNNLAFETEKKAVVEEFTGRDCVFCPGGLLTMEHLEQLYGERIVPIALHCYMGQDPKGLNVMDYWEFTGMNAAPQARVNRGPISSPLLQTPSGMVNMGVNGEKLWKDYVIEEFNEPSLIEIFVEEKDRDGSSINYKAYVRSAMNISDRNIRLFGVLLEDGLVDYQQNNYYGTSDPILGAWGAGGLYGIPMPYYTFNNVARSTWGLTFNGTAGIIPSYLEAGKVYEFDMPVEIPWIVENRNNLKFAVMLIDDASGRVLNANVSTATSGVKPNFANDINTAVKIENGAVVVSSSEDTSVEVYDIAGKKVAAGRGSGTFSVNIDGTKGILLVRMTNSKGSKTLKVIN